MSRNTFRQLLRRYVDGTANEEETKLIDQWYDLLYNEKITVLNEAELDVIENEMWMSIQQEATLTQHRSLSKTPVRKIIIRWVAAAAILAGLVFGIYQIAFLSKNSVAYQDFKEKDKLIETVNNSSAPKKVQLDDGTIITLQPSSKIAHPNHFSSDKREVYLEGEAFFDVAKNPEKPFLVHSGNLITQVIGTSFTIKPDKETNQIMVSVKTGRVAVFENSKKVSLDKEQQKNNGAIITPNQKVIYNAADRYFTTSLADNPEPVIPDGANIAGDTLFSFDDTTLASVLDKISKWYVLDILVENENIYQCRFTGDISNESLLNKLQLICESTNLSYEIKGTKILIKGRGCN